MMARLAAVSLAISFLTVAPGFAQPAESTPNSVLDSGNSELRPLILRYTADLTSLNRTYPIEFSARRISRMRAFIAEQRGLLAALDFDALSHDAQVDYVAFRNHLTREEALLNQDEQRINEAEPYIPFYDVIVLLEENRRKMEPIQPQAIGDTLAELATLVHDAQEAAPEVGAKPVVINRAALRIDDLRRALGDWYTFYNGYDPLFTWWADEPYGRVTEALDTYATYLRDDLLGLDKDEIIGDPVGRQGLIDNLSYNMIPYTPEELLEIARKELVWGEEEMRKASREMGYGDDWKQALEAVKNEYVEPGQQPQLVRRLANEAVDFVTSRDLVTVPELAREDWWEEMLDPESQLTSPFFLGGDLIWVAFPTSTMTQEQKLNTMRGNNEHFSRAVVFHELIPGHHLQGFMRARYRQYRDVFETPFWVEGNAFYWEMRLWDAGFPRGPEDRIGMLFWRMHRAARIIFSVSFHLEQMTAQECVDFLVDRVGFERFNAEAEVRRSVNGTYEPIYQSAYMLGALQFYALRKELVDSGQMTDRAFHDAILHENTLPVELVRAILIDEPLTRDYTSNWRFYELGQ